MSTNKSLGIVCDQPGRPPSKQHQDVCATPLPQFKPTTSLTMHLLSRSIHYASPLPPLPTFSYSTLASTFLVPVRLCVTICFFRGGHRPSFGIFVIGVIITVVITITVNINIVITAIIITTTTTTTTNTTNTSTTTATTTIVINITTTTTTSPSSSPSSTSPPPHHHRRCYLQLGMEDIFSGVPGDLADGSSAWPSDDV